MKLVELMAAIALLVIIVVAVFPGKNLYSRQREDAYTIASTVRACAILSLGNASCQTAINGSFIQLSCSEGYSRVKRLNTSFSHSVSFTCSEGTVENPSTIDIGNFQVIVLRRGVNIINKLTGEKIK